VIAASPKSGVNTLTGEGLADPEARFFGAHLEERMLLPGGDARTFDPRFEDWLAQTAPQKERS
jgi:hypothetical protein